MCHFCYLLWLFPSAGLWSTFVRWERTFTGLNIRKRVSPSKLWALVDLTQDNPLESSEPQSKAASSCAHALTLNRSRVLRVASVTAPVTSPDSHACAHAKIDSLDLRSTYPQLSLGSLRVCCDPTSLVSTDIRGLTHWTRFKIWWDFLRTQLQIEWMQAKVLVCYNVVFYSKFKRCFMALWCVAVAYFMRVLIAPLSLVFTTCRVLSINSSCSDAVSLISFHQSPPLVWTLLRFYFSHYNTNTVKQDGRPELCFYFHDRVMFYSEVRQNACTGHLPVSSLRWCIQTQELFVRIAHVRWLGINY